MANGRCFAGFWSPSIFHGVQSKRIEWRSLSPERSTPEVELLHVIDVNTLEALNRLGLALPSRETSQRKKLNRQARLQLRRLLEWELAKGVPIRRDVVESVPFVEIGRAVRTEQIDLVVLGSWGGETGNVERIFFGSTAEKVVRTAGRPVLAVPLHVRRPYLSGEPRSKED